MSHLIPFEFIMIYSDSEFNKLDIFALHFVQIKQHKHYFTKKTFQLCFQAKYDTSRKSSFIILNNVAFKYIYKTNLLVQLHVDKKLSQPVPGT